MKKLNGQTSGDLVSRPTECSVDGCTKPVNARELCKAHYYRLNRYGDPLARRKSEPRPPRPKKTCSIDGCDLEHYGKGWCENHYARWRRHGSTEDIRALSIPPLDRFAELVAWDGEHLLWLGEPNNSGYGSFKMEAESVGAHVASVLLDGQDVPKGMQVDHLCRIRICVLRDHLEVVTARVNNLRSFSASSLNAKKTHCIRGHEFTPENTYAREGKRGPERRCRECQRATARRLYREAHGQTA